MNGGFLIAAAGIWTLVAIAILLVIALMVVVSCIKIVPQARAVVLERLGGYRTTWSVGLHVKAPFIDRVAKRVNLKEQGDLYRVSQ